MTTSGHAGNDDLTAGMHGVAVMGAGGVSALVERFEAGQRVQLVQTPADTVVIRLMMGSCLLSVGVGTQWSHPGELGEGMLHVSPAHQWVRSQWLGGGEMLLLCVPVQHWRMHVAAAMGDASPADGLRVRTDATLLPLAKMLANAALDGADQAFLRHMLDAVMACMLATMASAGDAQRSMPRLSMPRWRLQRVAQLVQQRLAETITLADMASAAGMSPMHFAARFRAATGQRPHHYLLQCRVQQAKSLLADTAHPLVDIALSVGFRTQAHFCTVFKNFEHMTPMQWRRSRLQRAA
ncbi:helix-turn-helix domain-containing protein [Dyella sp. C9]|uniref:helix-turn-helix domain-containing protein n=1 Tax=Dyella sp. C9 TaxID=2202154 RepID=UPI0018E57B12|nr:AraC family transcriptional regulator [Dyella sp. C9]